MDIKTWLSEQSHHATSVFHIGRYCHEWKASTYSTGNASFHAILEGKCWLSMESQSGVTPLNEGDIIFFFSCLPFHLLSTPDKGPEELPKKDMIPLKENSTEGTALVCGFLHPRNHQSELLFAMMPDYLIIRRNMQSNEKIHIVLELLKIECCESTSENELIITRLTDMLLVYIVEAMLEKHLIDINLIMASQSEKMSDLFLCILRNPQEEWSIDRMAVALHMSRSTCIRKIQSACGYTPNEVVARLRMNTAINLLRRGYTVERVASMVGYNSLAGFYKAFKKVTFSTPSEISMP